MKYEPKKVFIKENGENVEITYQEHQYRQSSDAEYQKKIAEGIANGIEKFLPVEE